MTEPPELLSVIRQWVQKAESDFKIAEHTLHMRPDECPYDTVCFHAQQDLLSEYAAKSRYPGPFLLGSPEASQAMAIARRIRDWARTQLPKAALS